MQITIEVDEALLRAVAEREIRATFAPADRLAAQGDGAKAMRRQAETWAIQADYSALIEEVAPLIAREVVADVVRKAVEKVAQRHADLLKKSGKLAALIEQASLPEPS